MYRLFTRIGLVPIVFTLCSANGVLFELALSVILFSLNLNFFLGLALISDSFSSAFFESVVGSSNERIASFSSTWLGSGVFRRGTCDKASFAVSSA